MNFATIHFLVFITIVFILYWRLGHKPQNLLLLASSYYFYGCWDWRFLSLLVVSSSIDYIAGARIHASENPRVRRAWLIGAVAGNLAILGYFKYFNFFIQSFADFATALGLHVSLPTLNIILPVGISFFTFQSITYSVDIYRRELTPTKSYLDYATFVAFFPQLVAGPIVRAKEFLFQLEAPRRFSYEKLESGLVRFLFGFFKKSFVADTIAVQLVDPVFSNPSHYSTGTLWLAILGWTVQIYADFSGYSSMAVGASRIFGFEIPENFRFPYLATSISEYWRRWNSTMSRFFFDYIYVGLGGNRRGTLRTLLNVMTTTFLSGLWHGANWTFVVWGSMHGVSLCICRLWRNFKKRYALAPILPPALGVAVAWLLTQSVVCLTRIFFRAPDFATAAEYTAGLFSSPGSAIIPMNPLLWIAFIALPVDHAAGWWIEHRGIAVPRIPNWAKAAAYAAMIVFLFHARISDVQPFVYFQF